MNEISFEECVFFSFNKMRKKSTKRLNDSIDSCVLNWLRFNSKRKAQKPNPLYHSLTPFLLTKRVKKTLILSGFFPPLCLIFLCVTKRSAAVVALQHWMKNKEKTRVRTPILNIEMFMVMVRSLDEAPFNICIFCVPSTPQSTVLYIGCATLSPKERMIVKNGQSRKRDEENSTDNMECKCCWQTKCKHSFAI